jgi:chromate transport protein ChrA
MLRRWAGAALAVLAVSVPSAAVTVLLTWAFTSLGGSRPAVAVLAAVLAAAVGMMWAAAWLLVRPQLRGRTWPRTVVLAAGAFVALATGFASPIVVLAVAAAIGFVWTGEERA